MPRPSMAAQRKEEILDALEVCILKMGIDGTSLDAIADQAKMKRSILRHYIGNRDDIICALSERWRVLYSEQWQQTLSWLPEHNRLPALLDILFGPRSTEYIQSSQISDALFQQAKRLPGVKQHQVASMKEFKQIVQHELERAHPNASEQQITVVAAGFLSCYLHAESLIPLGMESDIRQQRLICETLLQSL